ncbi:MAG TPA: hypothetical protein VGB08_10300 [Allosphingosinicella sp.]|jgi:hypothetical protein
MRRRQPARPVRKGWTVLRATGLGSVAAVAAIVLRLFYPASPELVRPPLLALCALSAFCGLSILWITAVDRLRHGRRGERLVPLRTFDIALALLLLLPGALMVPALLTER